MSPGDSVQVPGECDCFVEKRRGSQEASTSLLTTQIELCNSGMRNEGVLRRSSERRYHVRSDFVGDPAAKHVGLSYHWSSLSDPSIICLSVSPDDGVVGTSKKRKQTRGRWRCKPASYRNNCPLPATFSWRTSRGGGVGTMATFHAKSRAPTVVKEQEKLKADSAIPHSVQAVSGDGDHCRVKQEVSRQRGATFDKSDQDLQVLG